MKQRSEHAFHDLLERRKQSAKNDPDPVFVEKLEGRLLREFSKKTMKQSFSFLNFFRQPLVSVPAIAVILLVITAWVVVPGLKNNDSARVPLTVDTELPRGYFTLTPSDEDALGVAPDATFALTAQGDISCDEIEKSFSISPRVDVAIVSKGSRECEVQPKVALVGDIVYQFALVTAVTGETSTAPQHFQWAFQTRDELSVTGTLPRDRATSVPIDTGIELTFSSSAVRDVEKHFSISPSTKGRFEDHGRVIAFVPNERLKRNTLYTVTLTKGVPTKDSDVTLPEDVTFRFVTEMESGSSYVAPLNVEFPAVKPDEAPFFESPQYGEKPGSVSAIVYAVPTRDELVKRFSAVDAVPQWAYGIRERTDVSIEGLETVGEFDLLAHDDIFEFPTGFDEGFYIIEFAYGESRQKTPLVVTPIAVSLTVTESNTVVWAYDVTTDTPIVGAIASLSMDTATAKTDERGVAELATPAIVKSSERDFGRGYAFLETKDGHKTLAPIVPVSNWIYGFGSPYGQTRYNESYWSHLWADRSLYRPDDTINVWGVIKNRTAPQKETVTLAVENWEFTDGNGDRVPLATQTVQTDEFGSMTASIDVRALKPGYYIVTASVNDVIIVSKSFEVRTFVKPAYTVSVVPNAPAFLDGDTITYDVTTRFFDGTPAPRVTLKHAGYGTAGQADGTAFTTDENGKATIRMKAEYSYPDRQYPMTWHQSFFPTESADGDIISETDVVIFPSAVTMDPNTEIDGERVTLSLTTTMVDLTDPDPYWSWYGQKTQEGQTPAPKIRLEGSVYELVTNKTKRGTRYDPVEKKVIDLYDYSESREQRETFTGVTDGKGDFSKSFTLSGDRYLIDVAAFDAQGRKVVRNSYVYRGSASWYSGYQQSSAFNVRDTSANEAPQAYAVGDATTLAFQRDGEAVTDNGPFLFLKFQNGVRNTYLSDDATFDYTFAKEDAPNVHFSGVWYDGEGFRGVESWSMAQLLFDETTRKLDVTVSPRGSTYAPGDKAKVDITVKDADGHAVSAVVNVSGIDEALAAIQWDNPAVPLESLYRPVSAGVLQQYESHTSFRQDSAAEGGGGGGGVRKNFKDALVFTTVQTGSDGKATIDVDVPDNITSWRLTAQAVTEDLYAGDTMASLVVTKPIFGTLTAANEYVVADRPVVFGRAHGVDLKENDPVTMRLAIPTLSLDESRTVPAFSAVRFVLPELSVGTHSATLTVTKGNASDELVRTFVVTPSRLTQRTAEYLEAREGLVLSGSDNERTTLVLSDAGRGRILSTLESLQWSSGKRLDRNLAALIATETLRRLGQDDALAKNDFDARVFQQDDGGISLISYGSSDLRLSAFAAMYGDVFERERLSAYFVRWLTEKEVSKEHVGYALLGLAALNEPVLPELHAYLKDNDLSARDQLNAGLALYVLGAYDEADVIATQLVKDHGVHETPYVRMNIGETDDEQIVATAHYAILAEGLKRSERTGLWWYTADHFPKSTVTNLERTLAMAAAVPNLGEEKVSLRYTIGSGEQTVELSASRQVVLSLTPEELKTFTVTGMTGSVSITKRSTVAVDMGSAQRDERVSINRTYRNFTDPNGAFEEGDVVEVRLAPSVKSGVLDKEFFVTDELPSGLVLVSEPWNRGIPWSKDLHWPLEVYGQRVTFYSDGNTDFQYYARVATPGVFSAEPALIQGQTSRDIVNYSGGLSLEIR